MKLRELMDLISHYNSTFYLRKLYYGDHERAVEIKKFISTLKQDPDYALQPNEEFQLALLLLSLNDDLPLIGELKKLFNHSFHLFPILACLKANDAIEEATFSKIQNFNGQQIAVLDTLIGEVFQPSQLSKDLLKTLVFTLDNSPFIDQVEACFTLLSNKNLINENSLKVLEIQVNSVSPLLSIFKLLDNQLTNKTLKILQGFSSLLQLNELLPLLYQAEINRTDELFTLLSQSKDLRGVTSACRFLINVNKTLFDAEYLKSILQIDATYILPDALKLLESNHLLNKTNVNKILKKGLYHLTRSLEIFDKNKLVCDVFNLLIESNLSIHSIYQSAKFLADLNLLNRETFMLIFKNQISIPLKSLLDLLPNRVKLGNQALIQLSSYKLPLLLSLEELVKKLANYEWLTQQLFEQLLNLSPDYYDKLLALATAFEEHNQLNLDTINKLFVILANKITQPEEEKCVVEKKFEDNSPLTELCIETKQFHLFFKENLKQETFAGGRGTILKGSTTLANGGTHYLLKTLHDCGSNEERKKEARKEAKYAQFLGRKAYFFGKDQHWHVVSEWQHGQTLDTISKKDLLNTLSLKTLLGSLLPLLKELSQLHAKFRVHGDIKNQNCVLDKQTMQLKLIDFGSTRKVKSKHYQIAWTPCYTDKYLKGFFPPINQYSFCDDIYALGIVIASLFPKLYLVNLDKWRATVKNNHPFSTLSTEEKTVFYLVSAMLNSDRKARPTSEDVLTYVDFVLQVFDELSNNDLALILVNTLHKTSFSFNDIMKDHSTHKLNLTSSLG